MDSDQLQRFKAQYGGLPDEVLAKRFGIPIRRVRVLAGVHRLGKNRSFEPKKMPRWTPRDLVALHRLYSAHSNMDIARRLGRTTLSVAARANRLGLTKSDQRRTAVGRTNVAARKDR